MYYSGGERAFIEDVRAVKLFQDEYLYVFKLLDINEVSRLIEVFMNAGLHFDAESQSSSHFCVLTKEGFWWENNWLKTDRLRVWFIADINCPMNSSFNRQVSTKHKLSHLSNKFASI